MDDILTVIKIAFDFSAVDSSNVTIFIVGYLVVFFALVLLYLVFNYFPGLLKVKRRRELAKKGKSVDGKEVASDISGEVNAAIGMALHLYFSETHDAESFKSTIKRVSRTYSPWSSKIYNVRNAFNRL